MKKRAFLVVVAILLLVAGLVAVGLLLVPSVAPRPVRLVVTGPDGQRFSGTFSGDGITNTLSAVAPATISFLARDVAFEFRRDGGDGEFRVALYVGEHCRTSTTSGNQSGVRGQLRYSSSSEKYWVAGY